MTAYFVGYNPTLPWWKEPLEKELERYRHIKVGEGCYLIESRHTASVIQDRFRDFFLKNAESDHHYQFHPSLSVAPLGKPSMTRDAIPYGPQGYFLKEAYNESSQGMTKAALKFIGGMLLLPVVVASWSGNPMLDMDVESIGTIILGSLLLGLIAGWKDSQGFLRNRRLRREYHLAQGGLD